MSGRRDPRSLGFSHPRMLGLAGLALLTGFVVRGRHPAGGRLQTAGASGNGAGGASQSPHPGCESRSPPDRARRPRRVRPHGERRGGSRGGLRTNRPGVPRHGWPCPRGSRPHDGRHIVQRGAAVRDGEPARIRPGGARRERRPRSTTTRRFCRFAWMTSGRTMPGYRSGASASSRGRAWRPRRRAGASRPSTSCGNGTIGRCWPSRSCPGRRRS